MIKRKSDAETTRLAESLYDKYVATQGINNAVTIFTKVLKKTKDKRRELKERDKK